MIIFKQKGKGNLQHKIMEKRKIPRGINTKEEKLMD